MCTLAMYLQAITTTRKPDFIQFNSIHCLRLKKRLCEDERKAWVHNNTSFFDRLLGSGATPGSVSSWVEKDFILFNFEV